MYAKALSWDQQVICSANYCNPYGFLDFFSDNPLFVVPPQAHVGGGFLCWSDPQRCWSLLLMPRKLALNYALSHQHDQTDTQNYSKNRGQPNGGKRNKQNARRKKKHKQKKKMKQQQQQQQQQQQHKEADSNARNTATEVVMAVLNATTDSTHSHSVTHHSSKQPTTTTSLVSTSQEGAPSDDSWSNPEMVPSAITKPLIFTPPPATKNLDCDSSDDNAGGGLGMDMDMDLAMIVSQLFLTPTPMDDPPPSSPTSVMTDIASSFYG